MAHPIDCYPPGRRVAIAVKDIQDIADPCLTAIRSDSIRSSRYSRIMAKPIPLGTRGESEQQVEFKHTLTAWRDELPPVYSTPHMIGQMEAAAFYAMLPFCEGDEVSVGTAINVTHRAPALAGMVIKTEAVLESSDGRFYRFRVSAHNGHEVIGSGTVDRAIVSKNEFEAKQRKKMTSAR